MQGFEYKKTSKVLRSHMVDMLCLGLPFLAIIIALFVGYIPKKYLVPVIIIAGIIAVIGLIRQIRRFKFMSCGECEAMLKVDHNVDGDPITFTCNHCKIVWETEFTNSRD